MQAVKVLPKWQITIPKTIRKKMDLKVGETFVIEEKEGQVVLKRGKTIFDYVGTLPKMEVSIEEIRELAISEAAHERI
ncbi:MAG: AbrB/MazE/SpoVT family DNA-binding domain-containing protein [Proteobacteria bacterium]|nr:AbrB/MazE/SpoVT family DNA-binding domain-containing protein [Pseudomonadota bacterium]